jgi:ribonuclease HI
MWLRVRC